MGAIMISLPRLSLNMKPVEKNLKELFFQIITETHLRCGVVWEVQHKRIYFFKQFPFRCVKMTFLFWFKCVKKEQIYSLP